MGLWYNPIGLKNAKKLIIFGYLWPYLPKIGRVRVFYENRNPVIIGIKIMISQFSEKMLTLRWTDK